MAPRGFEQNLAKSIVQLLAYSFCQKKIFKASLFFREEVSIFAPAKRRPTSLKHWMLGVTSLKNSFLQSPHGANFCLSQLKVQRKQYANYQPVSP
jgi:hypothetical protein